jgi:hypothetical protein
MSMDSWTESTTLQSTGPPTTLTASRRSPDGGLGLKTPYHFSLSNLGRSSRSRRSGYFFLSWLVRNKGRREKSIANGKGRL